MKRRVGIWIDHRKVVFVELGSKEDKVWSLESELEKHTRLAGGSRTSSPYGPQDVASEPQRERRYEKHLESYYHKVLESLGVPDRVFLLGPGPAKHELRRELLESPKHRGLRIDVETTDKLTDNQIVERVRQHFGEPTRRA